MQVNVIKVDGTAISFEVKLASNEFKAFRNAAFKRIADKASLPGFRKGHVPEAIVLKNYGDRIANEALNDAVNKTMPKALAETGHAVLARSVTVTGVNNNEDGLVFTCAGECIPVVTKKDLKRVNVELVKVGVCDADVDSVVERLRDQQAKWQVEDGAVVDDDSTANIDFLGKKDGVPFEGGAAKGYNLNIKTAQMIPGFIEQIKGHKAGESFTINVTFPDNYQAVELQGAAATFDITVNSVSKKVLPEIDNDFLKAYGFEDKGFDALKKSLRANLEQQSEISSMQYNLDSLISGIKEQYPEVAAPKSMVTELAEDMMSRQFSGQVNDQLKAALLGSFSVQAESRALEQILIDGLVKAENFVMELKPEDIDAQIEKAAIAYDDPEEFKTEVHKDKELLRGVSNAAANLKLTNFLANLVTTSTVEKSFDEFSKLLSEKDAAMQAKMLERLKAESANK